MTETPDPTWYDVLGVSRDASTDEIRAAWRSATDRFGPGASSSQFRMFNQAAEVLLDPERRAAYDEGLAAPEADPAPVEGSPEEPAADVDAEAAQPPAVASPAPAGRFEKLLAGVLAALLVVALAFAAYYGLQVRQDTRVADARDSAPATAERAAKAVLSYDYRRLDADQKRAKAFLTPSYAKEFDKTFALLKKNKDGSPGAALQTKAVVSATVAGSGVVDAEDGVVRVLVFVNQVSRKAGAQPRIFQNRVAMTMEKSGDKWLVDDLKSY
jgi:Mce-associated membrane protein